jgi:hypothetical protein
MSVADDLYSFGSICLYVLLSKAFQMAPPKAETVQAATNRAFIDLMSTLDNVSYATAFWKSLDLLRWEIELLLKQRNAMNTEQVKRILRFKEDGTLLNVIEDLEHKDSLPERSKRTTDEILQNLPYAEKIYEAIGKNTASFVLFMHFVICCLHRADTVPAKPSQTDLPTSAVEKTKERADQTKNVNAEATEAKPISPVFPFCPSRAEGPGKDGVGEAGAKSASERASNRMSIISDAIEQSEDPGILVGFRHDSKATFQPRSELYMRIQLEEIKRQLDSRWFLTTTLVRRLARFNSKNDELVSQ